MTNPLNIERMIDLQYYKCSHISKDEPLLLSLGVKTTSLIQQLSSYTLTELQQFSYSNKVQPFDETGKFLLYKLLLGYDENAVKMVWNTYFGLAVNSLNTEISLKLVPHFKCLIHAKGQPVPHNLSFKAIRAYCRQFNYISSGLSTLTIHPKDPVFLANLIAALSKQNPQAVIDYVENWTNYVVYIQF